MWVDVRLRTLFTRPSSVLFFQFKHDMLLFYDSFKDSELIISYYLSIQHDFSTTIMLTYFFLTSVKSRNTKILTV